MKEDSVGRPIYKRKEPTSQGKQVYLYHIHQTKKWRIGPAHEGAEAHNCWLFITSKGEISDILSPIWPQMTLVNEFATKWLVSIKKHPKNHLEKVETDLEWPFPSRKG